jgi:hypothetical protein
MPRLQTSLLPDECVARLREQVQPRTLLSRLNIFSSPVSRVFGCVGDRRITLESSRDRFSKQFVGTLHPADGGTTVEYAWKAGLGHRMYGDARFDEAEILSFLAEWLGTQEI